MLEGLLPALIIIVCTDGHQCNPNRDAYRTILPQPSFDICLETLRAMPRQPEMVIERGEPQFMTTASCGLVSPQDITG